MSETEEKKEPSQSFGLVHVIKSSIIPTLVLALLYFFSNKYVVSIEENIKANHDAGVAIETRVQEIESAVTVKLLDAIDDLSDELENVTNDMVTYNLENKIINKSIINIEKDIIKINATLGIKESN